MALCYVVLIISCTCCLVSSFSLKTDLLTFSDILPGLYSNSKKYTKNSDETVQPIQNRQLMKTVIRPVEAHFLGDSFNVFVEQFVGARYVPYRQRLHSYSADESQRAIRLRVFRFVNSSVIPNLSRDLTLFKTLTMSDVVTQSGCDMFWRRLRKKTFVGSTGRDCLGSVRREPVRVSVSTTLTTKMLSTHEGWYRVKDGSKIPEAEISYNLVKIKKVGATRHTGKSKAPKRTSRHLNNIQNDLPNDKPYRYKKSKFNRLKHQKTPISISSLPTANSAWTLRNFRNLMDALAAGRSVHFHLELSGCLLPQQSKIERTTFGDSVDVFDHVIQRRGRRREYVKFATRKYQQTSRGYESAIREITVFRNGKVIVRMRMTKHDQVPLSYAASCRMYDYNARTGDIKFSTDPYTNVRRIKSYGLLKSSLKKGRRVRMSVDLSKCSGSDPYVALETGGELRGFDFINSGRGIEFSLTRPEVDLPRKGQRFLITRVMQNGDVIITDIAEEHSNSVNQDERHYRCSMKGNKSLEKPGEKAVKFYYL